MWPTITIISRCSDSVIIDILQDNYLMIHYGIISEKYKMHEQKNLVCPIEVVKAEVGQDFKPESGRHISKLKFSSPLSASSLANKFPLTSPTFMS